MISDSFLLDTNVLIEAKRRYYAFDICPGFWDALIIHHNNSLIESIDRIKKEINDGKYDDELKLWVKSTMNESFFKSTNDALIIKHFSEMANWVQNQVQFFPEAKAEFANGVDGWVCSYAKAKNKILVTHEVYAPDSRKKVPIPNICKEFNIPCLDTFQMLRKLKSKFILQP